eukprot:scaffold656_cov403-Pavlova_lutheri.AAC.44
MPRDEITSPSTIDGGRSDPSRTTPRPRNTAQHLVEVDSSHSWPKSWPLDLLEEPKGATFRASSLRSVLPKNVVPRLRMNAMGSETDVPI